MATEVNVSLNIDLKAPSNVFRRLALLQHRHDARELTRRELDQQATSDRAEWELVSRAAAAMLPEGAAVRASIRDGRTFRDQPYVTTREGGHIVTRRELDVFDLDSLDDAALNDALATEDPCRCVGECVGCCEADSLDYHRINPELDPLDVPVS